MFLLLRDPMFRAACLLPDRFEVSERDSKQIARQWEREIEDEIRRLHAPKDEGPWKAVVWLLAWVAWLGALILVFGIFRHFE